MPSSSGHRSISTKGLSHEKFAFEAHIHRTYISDIERGARNQTIVIVQKLADALGVTASDLLAVGHDRRPTP